MITDTPMLSELLLPLDMDIPRLIKLKTMLKENNTMVAIINEVIILYLSWL